MTEKKFLSIEDIEAQDSTTYKTLPAWGGMVRIASLTADEMIDYVESNEGPAGRVAGIRLLVRSLVDEEGKRIGKEEHVDIFRKKDTSTMSRLVGEAMDINGISRPKATAEATKNVSSEAPTGASPSTLH